MHHLVLLFAAAAMLVGCRSANVNKHMKLLPELDNNIEPNLLPPKHSSVRKFIGITRRPNKLTQLKPDSTLELTCEAIGAPAPSIHWFKNDAPIYEYDMESNEIIDTNPTSLARVTSTLIVSRAAGPGEYTCLATAGLKTTSATTSVYRTDGGINVDISERSKLIPLAPRILVAYKVYVDTIGSNIVLPCRAKGHPRPHVTWRDNKGNLVKKDPRMRVLRSGELVISPLRWSDMGEFTCHASNTFGSQLASTFVYPAKAG